MQLYHLGFYHVGDGKIIIINQFTHVKFRQNYYDYSSFRLCIYEEPR